MDINWGLWRSQLRRSVLKDEDAQTWSDDVLRDVVWWALDTFCAHTAAETGVNYPVTGAVYPIPDNVYESLEDTGFVYLQKSAAITYVQPWDYPEQTKGMSYRIWSNNIELSSLPDTDSTLYIRYFAFYNHPYADSDLITVPRWAFGGLSYLVGAFAMSPVAVQSANISQWKDRADSGQPENNALRVQHNFFWDMYHRELSQYPKQQRTQYWRRNL